MTLTEALASYLATSPHLSPATIRKLSHRLNAWRRWAHSDDLPCDETITAARQVALNSGLSPRTIETTISDVVALSNHCGANVSAGRRLRLGPVRCKAVPELAGIERLYNSADAWQYPTRLRNDDGSFAVIPQDLQHDWLRAFLVLGLWTGLRLKDLYALRWDAITEQRIAWQASKTSKEHRYPMCSVLWSHLAPLRKLNRPTVLGVSGTNPKLLRDKLHAAMPVDTITPQSLRRASVTTWATVSPEAGRIVHGTGLGVLRHYYDGEQILRACADRFPWPVSMLPPDQRDERQRLANETESVLARLSPERIADVLRVARAFAG